MLRTHPISRSPIGTSSPADRSSVLAERDFDVTLHDQFAGKVGTVVPGEVRVLAGERRHQMRGFGAIEALPSGRYREMYRGPDLKRHSAPVTFTTTMDADAWLTDERRLISAGTWSSPTTRAETERRDAAIRRNNVFSTYATPWLEGRHELRPTTRASYTTATD